MRADKSLSPFEIRLYRHYRIVHGIRIALAFILTFLLVRLFSIPEGTWPLITLVVIMGPISFWGNVVPRAFERIGGTILGAALGLVALRLELFFLTADAGVVCDSDVFVRLAGLREKTVSGATDRHNACRCCRRSRW
ncbi:Putative inner membrane protein [Salmonella enterica subsp. enterica serovar Heidelberg]|nr:Putative inner membrane protein [Salmonella enterica subsp. enterica serovar Heidelberg]